MGIKGDFHGRRDLTCHPSKVHGDFAFRVSVPAAISMEWEPTKQNRVTPRTSGTNRSDDGGVANLVNDAEKRLPTAS